MILSLTGGCLPKAVPSWPLWFGLACLLNWATLALAQSPVKNPTTIGLRLHRGYIIPHSDSIANISFSHPYQIEIDVSRHLVQPRTYQACNCFPRVGLSFFYTNFDNRAILGNAYSLLPYLEPYFRADKRLNFSFRLGMGVSYLNNVYDPSRNPLNLFYSSPISFLLMANISVNYKLSSHLGLRLAGNYNHISNAGLQDPNKGINYPTLSLGVDYTLDSHDFKPQERIDWRQLHPQRQRWQVAVFGMAKKAFRNEPNRYAIVGVAAYLTQVVGRINALTAGLEYIADFSQRETARRLSQTARYQDLGLLLGHEFLLGKFSFAQLVGIYLVSHPNNLDPLYQRYGLSYQLTPSLGVGVSMKVHRNVADFADVRLIYALKKR
jgi:Lipid A 3-O-deacylase (PagL)